MIRQGDLFIAPTNAIPSGAEPKRHLILAEGEITGHSHRVDGGPALAELFQAEDGIYLDVRAASVRVLHEEHEPVTLPSGKYRVWRQREYTPAEIRTVRD